MYESHIAYQFVSKIRFIASQAEEEWNGSSVPLDEQSSLDTSFHKACLENGARFKIVEIRKDIRFFLDGSNIANNLLKNLLTSDVKLRVKSMSAHYAGYFDNQGVMRLSPYFCAVWGIEGRHFVGSKCREYMHDLDSYIANWMNVQDASSVKFGCEADTFKGYAERILPGLCAKRECVLLVYSECRKQLFSRFGSMKSILEECIA